MKNPGLYAADSCNRVQRWTQQAYPSTWTAAVGQLQTLAATTDGAVATAPEIVADKGYHRRAILLELD